MNKQVRMITLGRVPVTNLIGVSRDKMLFSIDGELKIVYVDKVYAEDEKKTILMLPEILERKEVPEVIDEQGNTIFKREDWNSHVVERIFKEIIAMEDQS